MQISFWAPGVSKLLKLEFVKTSTRILGYWLIFLSCYIKNSYCGKENEARNLHEPVFESPVSDVYSNVLVENKSLYLPC